VKDACNNPLTSQTYSNKGSDQTAPTLTGSPYAGTTGTNSCKANATTAAPFSAANAIQGYADNCGGAVTATLTNTAVTGTDCAWTVTYTFTVKDACNNPLASQTYSNKGSDQTAPTLTGSPYAGTTGTNSCKANAATAAPFSAANAIQGYTDNCGGTVTPTLTNTSVTGSDAGWTVTYTFSIKDVCNNTLASQTYSNTGSDQTAPVINSVTVNPNCLWPPNHKMRDIAVTLNATDNCSSSSLSSWVVTSVTSNEPVNGIGDGNTGPDWIIGDGNGGGDRQKLQLRAERQGIDTGRVYTITFTATDGAGNTATTTRTVCVAHNITSPSNGNAFKVGSTVNFAGTFWDIAGNRHTAKWNIDGTLVSGVVVSEPSGIKSGKVTGSYKFTSPGIYKLQMNVTDQNGITSSVATNGDLEAIVVVYDPNGGYTYGSGCFVSPPGAIPTNPTATGPVSFGFQTNYYKGATNPKGETQFDFRAGDLEFNALNFDYLVVDGSNAQFKGSGKIIGDQSGYNFIMTVIDGDAPNGGGVDKIRMKIYNKNTGQVMYDNMPGAGDADLPTIVACPGSIIRITDPILPAMIVSSRQIETIPGVTQFNVKVFPNPTSDQFSLYLEGGNNDKVHIVVYDALGREVKKFEKEGGNIPVIFGRELRGGAYFVEVRQGENHKTIKLIKQN
jgi:hypothetical protein